MGVHTRTFSLSPHILNCYKSEMNWAFPYMEKYFSVLDRMTEPHTSSVVMHNFGKGGERKQMRLSSLWPCHITSFCQQSFQIKLTFSQVKSEKCPTGVLWRMLIHSGGEETTWKNIRSFLGMYITSHLSLFLLTLLWTLTLPFWILSLIMSCCSLIHKYIIFEHKKVAEY